MLESIRAYAAERLAGSGAELGARRRHVDHYLDLAERAAQKLATSDQRIWLDRLAAEQPNLRAALAYSVDAEDIDSAWRLIASLQRFWDVTGPRREAHEWIQRTLALGDPPATPAAVAGLAAASAILHPLDSQAAFNLASQAQQLAAGLDALTRAKAALAVGFSAGWVQPELARSALQEALAGFGDDQPWWRALTMQGLASASGALSEALQWGRDSITLFRSVGDKMFAANALFIMAQRAIHAGIGDDEVHAWLTESKALAEAAGSEGDTVHATVGFALLAWLRGNHHGAAQLMEECLPRLRRLGDRRCTGRALFMLGDQARVHGDLGRAGELLQASIEAALAGQSVVLISALEALAAVLSAQGRPRVAAVVMGAAQADRKAAGARMRPIQPPDEELRRSLQEALGATEFDRAHAEGEQLSATDVLRLAPFT